MAQALSLSATQTIPLSLLSVNAQRAEPGHSMWHRIHSNLNLFCHWKLGRHGHWVLRKIKIINMAFKFKFLGRVGLDSEEGMMEKQMDMPCLVLSHRYRAKLDTARTLC